MKGLVLKDGKAVVAATAAAVRNAVQVPLQWLREIESQGDQSNESRERVEAHRRGEPASAPAPPLLSPLSPVWWTNTKRAISGDKCGGAADHAVHVMVRHVGELPHAPLTGWLFLW